MVTTANLLEKLLALEGRVAKLERARVKLIGGHFRPLGESVRKHKRPVVIPARKGASNG